MISTKRSGHHAFIQWLRSGMDQPSEFHNNTIIGDKFEKQLMAGRASLQPKTLIFNYEGVSPKGLETARRIQKEREYISSDILFLRDPLNLCASLMHRKQFLPLHIIMIMRQLIAQGSWIDRYVKKADPGLRLVFYNTWLARPDIRERLSAQLGLLKNVPVSDITRHGGGSSFGDLSSVDGQREIDKLQTRWQRYRGHSLFDALMSHESWRPGIERMVDGKLADCLGEADYEESRAQYLAELALRPRRHWLVDRAAAALAAEPELLWQLERQNAREKKATLLKIHLKMLRRPPLKV